MKEVNISKNRQTPIPVLKLVSVMTLFGMSLIACNGGNSSGSSTTPTTTSSVSGYAISSDDKLYTASTQNGQDILTTVATKNFPAGVTDLKCGVTICAVSTGTGIYTSSDLINWSLLSASSSLDLNQLMVNDFQDASSGVLMGVGKKGTIVTAKLSGGAASSVQTIKNIPTTEDLHDIQYASLHKAQKYIAVGDKGTIVVADASNPEKFLAVNSGVSSDLHSISCNDDGSSCVVVGASGQILRSTDGSKWSLVSSPTANDLLEVIYVKNDNFTGYGIAGNNGTILYSQDNGLTWRSLSVSNLLEGKNADSSSVNNQLSKLLPMSKRVLSSVSFNQQGNSSAAATIINFESGLDAAPKRAIFMNDGLTSGVQLTLVGTSLENNSLGGARRNGRLNKYIPRQLLKDDTADSSATLVTLATTSSGMVGMGYYGMNLKTAPSYCYTLTKAPTTTSSVLNTSYSVTSSSELSSSLGVETSVSAAYSSVSATAGVTLGLSSNVSSLGFGTLYKLKSATNYTTNTADIDFSDTGLAQLYRVYQDSESASAYDNFIETCGGDIVTSADKGREAFLSYNVTSNSTDTKSSLSASGSLSVGTYASLSTTVTTASSSSNSSLSVSATSYQEGGDTSIFGSSISTGSCNIDSSTKTLSSGCSDAYTAFATYGQSNFFNQAADKDQVIDFPTYTSFGNVFTSARLPESINGVTVSDATKKTILNTIIEKVRTYKTNYENLISYYNGYIESYNTIASLDDSLYYPNGEIGTQIDISEAAAKSAYGALLQAIDHQCNNGVCHTDIATTAISNAQSYFESVSPYTQVVMNSLPVGKVQGSTSPRTANTGATFHCASGNSEALKSPENALGIDTLPSGIELYIAGKKYDPANYSTDSEVGKKYVPIAGFCNSSTLNGIYMEVRDTTTSPTTIYPFMIHFVRKKDSASDKDGYSSIFVMDQNINWQDITYVSTMGPARQGNYINEPIEGRTLEAPSNNAGTLYLRIDGAGRDSNHMRGTLPVLYVKRSV